MSRGSQELLSGSEQAEGAGAGVQVPARRAHLCISPREQSGGVQRKRLAQQERPDKTVLEADATADTGGFRYFVEQTSTAVGGGVALKGCERPNRVAAWGVPGRVASLA